MMLLPLSLIAALAVTATAKTVIINVGQSGLSFSPDSTTAAVGDMLEFHFFSSFHTAVSGDFSSPCQMSNSGFNSGSISSSSVFQVMVKDTNPIWFFCGTPGHCQSGMAGVINPPSSGDSLATYKSNAAGSPASSSGTVQGGVVAPVPSAGASSSTTPSSSSVAVPPSSSSVAPSSSEAPSSSSSVALRASSGTSSLTPLSATSTAPESTLKASTPAGPTFSTAGSSTSTTSTGLSSPTSVTTSGAIAAGRFGLADALVFGLAVLVGIM